MRLLQVVAHCMRLTVSLAEAKMRLETWRWRRLESYIWKGSLFCHALPHFSLSRLTILGERIKKKNGNQGLNSDFWEYMRKSVLVALISRIACRCRNALKSQTFFKHVIFNFVKCKFWIYYIEIQNCFVVIQPDVGFDGKKIPNPHSPD